MLNEEYTVPLSLLSDDSIHLWCVVRSMHITCVKLENFMTRINAAQSRLCTGNRSDQVKARSELYNGKKLWSDIERWASHKAGGD